MNYGEIKHNLISLGFAEEDDYAEYEELGYTYDAINRAIDIIRTDFPYVDWYEFELDDTDTGPFELDMAVSAPGFIELAKDTPVRIEANGQEVFQPFSEYEIKMDRVLHINADRNKGIFRVYYNRTCTTIGPETADTFIPEIPIKVHHLIPLLAAYYLWLDDDVAKATQYQNLYEEKLVSVIQKENAPRMRVNTEWRGL